MITKEITTKEGFNANYFCLISAQYNPDEQGSVTAVLGLWKDEDAKKQGFAPVETRTFGINASDVKVDFAAFADAVENAVMGMSEVFADAKQATNVVATEEAKP